LFFRKAFTQCINSPLTKNPFYPALIRIICRFQGRGFEPLITAGSRRAFMMGRINFGNTTTLDT